MRKLLILLLFALLPLAQADDGVYRICSAKILNNLIEDRASVNERISQIGAASSPDELLALAEEFTKFARFLPFRTAYCQEGYETIWRLHQRFNDAYAAQSLRLAGVADTDNPYVEAIEASREPLDRQYRQLEALLADGERDDLDESGGSSDTDCYYEDMAVANERGIEFRSLVDGAKAAGDMDELLAYSSAAVYWHEGAWSVLPNCGFVYTYLIDWSRLLHAAVSSRALELTGVTIADDPFRQERYEYFQVGAGETTDMFALERLRVEKRPTLEDTDTAFGLPDCTIADLDNFANMPAEFASLVEQAERAQTTEERLRFISRQVEWRRQLWLHMPMCQQALELTWLMQQISTDYSAIFALSYLAQADLQTPYHVQVQPSNDNMLRLQELLDAFEAYLSGALALPAPASATLYTCGDAALERSFWDFGDGYSDVLRLAMTMESLDDALQYSSEYVEWRAGLFSSLPTCPEAIEQGWLMLLILTGNAHLNVLEQAGLPPSDNPYTNEVDATESRSVAVNRALFSKEPMAKESVTPGKSQLPECSQSESLPIALSALKYTEMLEYPRATSIAEMLDYAATYLEWRAISFDQFPLCFEAHQSRLLFTQVAGDVIARRTLDIDGRLYSGNPFRALPNDSDRFSQLTDTLYASRSADGPAPDEREIAACNAGEIETLAELARGLGAFAQLAETPEYTADLPAFHARILSWRDDLMARLPQCAGAVALGWLMNDIHIDLAVVGSLAFVGADVEALPHADIIAENLSRLSLEARELDIEI